VAAVTDEVDLARLGRIAAEVAEIHGRAVEESSRLVAAELSPAEQELMARGLAASSVDELRNAEVLRNPRSLLELNYRELIQDGLAEFKRGNAKLWLADQLTPVWASRWELRLPNVLAPERRERIAYLAGEMRRVGIHDLDKLTGE
jgi:hypothetical protein